MTLFIIYGTKGVARAVGSGTFVCPCCGTERRYDRKQVRRYFCLYFLPLIPLDHLGDTFECQTCLRQFDPKALMEYEATYMARLQDEFFEVVKRLTVLAAMSDADDDHPVNDAEIDAIRAVAIELSGNDLTRSEVDRELYLARLSRTGLAPYPSRFPGGLDASRKMEAIRAVYKVATADGPLSPRETAFLDRLAAEMEFSPNLLKQILYGVATA